MRWEQVADAMQPRFTLASGDDALKKVLPTTARLQEQVLNAFGLSLGVGLPQRFSESTVTRSGGSESRTEMETRKPGVAPTPPTGTPAGGAFPDASSPGTEVGVDPMLQYEAAASLFQAVQLMNRAVQFAASRERYVPYMVRLQLANMPYRRNLAYDVHAQVSFFPAGKTLAMKDATEETALPYVVPLIATDNLEQAIKSRAVDVARQIGVALSFMLQGVGGNLGANAQNRERDAVLAADINSLLTVARLTDNGIYIRLGAANSASAGNSLVGRTYDIALLVLVPRSYFLAEKPAASGGTGSDTSPPKVLAAAAPADEPERATLSVIAQTSLRNVETGALLDERRDASLGAQIDRAFERTLVVAYPAMYAAWQNKDAAERRRVGQALVASIQTSEYEAFYCRAIDVVLADAAPPIAADANCADKKIAFAADPANARTRLAGISEGYLRALWVYLSSVTIESVTKSASVELPLPAAMTIPDQTALIRDDASEHTTVVLRDVSGIGAQAVTARLALAPAGRTRPCGPADSGCYEFAAERIEPDAATGTLALQFPSPARWGIAAFDVALSRLLFEKRACPYEPVCPSADWPKDGLKVLHALAPAKPPAP